MKKTIALNGIVVGEYEATGDPDVDVALVRDFLKSKGLYREVSPAQAAFTQAAAFCRAAASIYERDLTGAHRFGPSAALFVVNAAFRIELYLKTLHQQSGSPTRGHNFLALYGALTDAQREAVLGAAQRHASSYGVSSPSVDSFRAIMESLAEAFVEWRYWHESGETGRIDVQPTILVLRALDETCRESGAA